MRTPSGFVFGSQVGTSLADGGGADREWLLTDGTGGYAMGTVAGLRTRRCHALLVTPEHRVALVALDPVLTLTSGARVELAVHQWASGAVAPQGHRLLALFDLTDGLPRWRWRIGDVVIERELAMERGRTGVAVVHRVVSAPEPVWLSLGVLCTWRDAEDTRATADGEVPPDSEQVADGVMVERAYRIAGPGWQPDGMWYYGAYTRQEAALGRHPTEDLWHAGRFTALRAAGEALEVSAWTGDLARRPPPATAVVAAAHQRARKVVLAAKPADEVDAQLALAADAFVLDAGPDGSAVAAGYPGSARAVPPDAAWPTADALAGYEGLFLETGRAEEGRALLRGSREPALGLDQQGSAHLERQPVTAIDVPLWYVHAVERHVTRTGDSDLAAELLPVLVGIVAPGLDRAPGALSTHGLRADPVDGLLTQDPEPSTSTWLDAWLGRHPATPPPGKPVEVNALWVNALGAVARLHELLGHDPGEPLSRYDAARTGFAKRYPAPEGWLYDVVDAPPPPYPLAGSLPYDDAVLRPGQLLAWSLPYAPLDATCPGPLGAVGAHLLTPLGLRSLAPKEYGYQGSYGGEDAARQRGTVWPWLIGAYVGACRVTGLPTDGVLAGLTAHLGEYGLGSVSELADGDPPHHPGGAPFHARSVAEFLRARRSA